MRQLRRIFYYLRISVAIINQTLVRRKQKILKSTMRFLGFSANCAALREAQLALSNSR